MIESLAIHITDGMAARMDRLLYRGPDGWISGSCNFRARLGLEVGLRLGLRHNGYSPTAAISGPFFVARGVRI